METRFASERPSGDHGDEPGVDFWRRHQTTNRFVEDEGSDAEQEQCVPGRRDDLEAIEPERSLVAPWPRCEPDRDKRECHARHVGEDVTCVGEEGKRVARNAGHDFRTQDAEADRECARKLRCVPMADAPQLRPCRVLHLFRIRRGETEAYPRAGEARGSPLSAATTRVVGTKPRAIGSRAHLPSASLLAAHLPVEEFGVKLDR